MSEYQYYEFLAVDRPLTPGQMSELRSISSRAEITPTQLTNTYSYGDFRGDPTELLCTYFDAHVYVANWGTYTLMLAFPRQAVDVDALKAYAVFGYSDYDDGVAVDEHDERVIVTFSNSDEEGGGGWMDEDEAAAWMPSLIQLRADIMNGDLRAMYLGWLAGATRNLDQYAVSDDEDALDEEVAEARARTEPPVPEGLGSLTGALQSLTEFLDISPGLVAVAAERSGELIVRLSHDAATAAWIAALVPAEKNALLARVVAGDATVGAELRRRIRAAAPAPSAHAVSTAPARTAGELAKAGLEQAQVQERTRAENEKRAREEHLERLVGQEANLWQRVESLVDQRQARPYDDAVALVRELSDLAAYRRHQDAFAERLAQLRARHKQKGTFITRLDNAGLR